MRLLDLMSCNRFEVINTFLHMVIVDEEMQNAGDALKKVQPLHDHLKQAHLNTINLSVNCRLMGEWLSHACGTCPNINNMVSARPIIEPEFSSVFPTDRDGKGKICMPN